mgnify:FL=1
MASSRRRPPQALFAVLLSAVLASAAAQASPAAPPENLVSFSASAQTEVAQDLLGITLQAVRDGSDAATVQAQLKQALDAALKEAKAAAQPGAMEVRSGNFSLFPRYGKDGKINGWQGQAELLLEGRDTERVARTAGRIQGMNITSVGFSLSREQAEMHEAAVTADAIRKYRARAAELARQFGFGGYTLREVSVQGGESGGPRPVLYRAQKADIALAAEAPVPVEPGKATVSVTVSGTVQLRP